MARPIDKCCASCILLYNPVSENGIPLFVLCVDSAGFSQQGLSLVLMVDNKLKTFFSYSREDSEFVVRLVKELRATGVAVWLDQLDINPGQHWDTEIEKALQECPRHVTVLSPAAVGSSNVMDEVSYALQEHKQVIPLLYSDCTIPFRLRRVQYIDFRPGY